ncbi:AraC-type DNA-binding protein [Pedobacter sp. ok626]|uniref:helix-turn-helix domain-containing protein n=1 Tax=Pedobacter sp. ok626 TaxID=1761882 RepID=UPI000881C723|nr:AraC family transcriptional regulator [Pedobacter sp. ok626]SDL10558.1 AraC-type DNA-binding protein [Pedobacter sp. ok626]
MAPVNDRPRIMSSCYTGRAVNGESFIAEHALAFQISGSLKVYDGNEDKVFTEGAFRLSIRNKLAKFVKIPPPNGEYKSLSIAFDRETLMKVAQKYNLAAVEKVQALPVIELRNHRFLSNFVDSLTPYLPFSAEKNDPFVQIKLEEALLVILKVHPELKNVLFDFSEPGKIDLQAFMEQNYMFNLKIPRFAYLTGRSLSAFKRDFEKNYNIVPSRWLLQKRLNEAYFLIKEKNKKSSEVYVEVGFEDLSHFSYVFKKQFGFPPSELAQQNISR